MESEENAFIPSTLKNVQTSLQRTIHVNMYGHVLLLDLGPQPTWKWCNRGGTFFACRSPHQPYCVKNSSPPFMQCGHHNPAWKADRIHFLTQREVRTPQEKIYIKKKKMSHIYDWKLQLQLSLRWFQKIDMLRRCIVVWVHSITVWIFFFFFLQKKFSKENSKCWKILKKMSEKKIACQNINGRYFVQYDRYFDR